ncbi:hypothetical protein GUJ93_ZPchr0014g47136 [Zizania palustris]|uniref:Uncharacterized protein n=1 Tax=Zizania palustris TaxID=103762 RepID=A0A8J5W5W9_ZIZPA|nr:hypothetical protein GUJ93_ZPchr0014g47136 [Zizania palustris]
MASSPTNTAAFAARRVPPPCWTPEETLALARAYTARRLAVGRTHLTSADWPPWLTRPLRPRPPGSAATRLRSSVAVSAPSADVHAPSSTRSISSTIHPLPPLRRNPHPLRHQPHRRLPLPPLPRRGDCLMWKMTEESDVVKALRAIGEVS